MVLTSSLARCTCLSRDGRLEKVSSVVGASDIMLDHCMLHLLPNPLLSQYLCGEG